MNIVNVDTDIQIGEFPKMYPEDLAQFAALHKLTLPSPTTKIGVALIAMMLCKGNGKYFNRKTCMELFDRLHVRSDDAIQSFNKTDQLGIVRESVRGYYRIKFPLEISPKVKMRKGFSYDGTEESKNNAINSIKQNLLHDYINVPNEQWQAGHKHPQSGDNSPSNMVLQPPIQGKYRDNFIFINAFTKIPTVNKLKIMINKNESPYTKHDLHQLRDYLLTLDLS